MAQLDIIMATYNGQKFIAQQIESILHQTFEDWRLLIHDDGSTDNTIEIIKRYLTDKRITIIDDKITTHNPAKNFLHTLQYSTADFSIFCDQDDIWLENKLEEQYNFAKTLDNAIPQVVCSNGYVYMCNTNDIAGKANLNFPKKLESLFFLNGGLLGCTMMINKKLRILCCDAPEFVSMHDQLVMITALTFGKANYLNKSLMLYRRYVGSVTATYESNKTDHAKLFFQSNKTVLNAKDYRGIKSFYNKNRNKMGKDKELVFQRLFKFEQHNRLINFFRVWLYGFNIFNSKTILSVKILLRKFV